MAAPAIVHESDGSRFVARVQGHLAVCDYRREGRVLHMTHTGVPSALQGQGLAAALVAAALGWARDQGLQVNPLCSYVAAYMNRHPETQDLRVS